LVAGGLLIATGDLNAYLFVPLAIVSCLAGSLVGYSWANFVGDRGLTAAAERLRQEGRVTRVAERIRAAGPLQIGVTRLIPGLRIVNVGISLALVTAGTIIAYLVVARWGLGATAGEALLGITYRQHPGDGGSRDGGAEVPQAVRAASRRFRVLGEERRLQLLG